MLETVPKSHSIGHFGIPYRIIHFKENSKFQKFNNSFLKCSIGSMNIREYSSFIICITLSVYFIHFILFKFFFNLFQDVITFKNVITFVITMSVNCISGKAMKWTHLRIHLGPFWRGGYYYLMDRLPNLPISTIVSFYTEVARSK